MSYNDKKSSADIAANIVIMLLAAVIVVLLCVYVLKLNGIFDKVEEIPEPAHVISETTAATTETTEIIITTTPAETQEEPMEITVPLGEYDEEFFSSVFIVGDSLSTGFVNYEFLPAENVFAQAGLTPSSIMFTEVNDALVYDKAAEAEPEYICIMLGTNGLAYLEVDFMSEKMSLFIDELRNICPESEIVLVSIPPVTASHEEEKPEKLEGIIAYNEQIEKLAEEKDVLFTETYSVLCDETGYLAEEYAETDGLHLKIYAYPVILSRIEETILNAELRKAADETSVTEETEAETTAAEESTQESETTTVPESAEETEIN